ncbi:O-antigen ligase family protein [Aeromonas veronii]|uniref:O-antigen ligase family protein n=1 Tax=Aeromonas veronii TaxID=654 RepID=UPI0020912E93|nr:O-antigen ligase family protein [Aeromonas veronii]
MKIKPSLYWCFDFYYMLPMLILSCFTFTTFGGKHYISRLVVVMFVISCVFCRNTIINNLKRAEVRIILFFWLSVVVFFSLYCIFRGEQFSMPRTILVSILYIVIVPWQMISLNIVRLSIVLGGVAAGILGVYEYAILDISRIGGVVNQIPFTLYVAITCVISIATYLQCDNKYLKVLSVVSILGSVFAIIMTEVRGVWLSIILTIISLVLFQLKRFGARRISLITAATLIVLFSFYTIPELSQRVNVTKQEFVQISKGNMDTSIGLRFQLWHSAIEIIKDHPLMGVGTKKYPDLMGLQYQQGMISELALSFKDAHFHNQYLDSYVRYGLIGVLAIIAIFLSPFFLYGKLDAGVKYTCLAIALICVFAALTDVPLIHTGIIYILIIYPAAIFLSCSNNASGEV